MAQLNFGGVLENVVTPRRIFTGKSKRNIKKRNRSRNRLRRTRSWTSPESER